MLLHLDHRKRLPSTHDVGKTIWLTLSVPSALTDAPCHFHHGDLGQNQRHSRKSFKGLSPKTLTLKWFVLSGPTLGGRPPQHHHRHDSDRSRSSDSSCQSWTLATSLPWAGGQPSPGGRSPSLFSIKLSNPQLICQSSSWHVECGWYLGWFWSVQVDQIISRHAFKIHNSKNYST